MLECGYYDKDWDDLCLEQTENLLLPILRRESIKVHRIMKQMSTDINRV